MGNIVKFERQPDFAAFNAKLISILSRSHNHHKVPVELITYVGVKEPKENNEWEVRFVSFADETELSISVAPSEAILLLIKLVRELGRDINSNIA